MLKKILKYLLYTFLGIVGFVLILLVALIGFQEKIDYQNTQKFKQAITDVPKHINKTLESVDTLSVGWSKVNITPTKAVPMAGYGSRGNFKKVHDSLFVRVFVIELEQKEFAIISLDLLLFPPEVREALEKEIPNIGLKKENLFYGAIHTHSGYGAWESSLVGSFMAGRYDQKIVNYIRDAILKGLKQAKVNKKKCEIGYGKLYVSKYLENRMPEKLIEKTSKADNYLRYIKFSQVDGKQAVLFSYASHPICLEADFLALSGDYPSHAVKVLEQNSNIDFACFIAGMVGGHGPKFNLNKDSYQLMKQIGKGLADTLVQHFDSTTLKPIQQVQSAEIPVPLPNPQFRLGNTFKIRNWAFRTFLGNPKVSLKVLRLGNILLIGTPCDFSGELCFPLLKRAKKKEIELFITSFNGNYMGYVTPDHYYKTYKTEVRDMNWFGPSGKYFQDLILKIIDEVNVRHQHKL